MVDFRVDLDGLQQVMSKLKGAEDAMREAMAVMHTLGPASLGTKKLDNACNDFQKEWKYGLGQISDDIKATTESVQATKETYSQLEAAVKALFTTSGAPGAAQPTMPVTEPTGGAR
jgi:Mg2+ and Co2+ transporter CorA